MSRKNRSFAKGDDAGGSRRIPRVEKEIREVVGSYLIRGFRGELPGLVSVSRVIVSKDLRTAKVLVTLLDAAAGPVESDAAEKALAARQRKTVDELQAHAHEIQSEINRHLQMKYCPKVTFFYDHGLEHALHVENVLRNLERARQSENSTNATQSEEAES